MALGFARWMASIFYATVINGSVWIYLNHILIKQLGVLRPEICPRSTIHSLYSQSWVLGWRLG